MECVIGSSNGSIDMGLERVKWQCMEENLLKETEESDRRINRIRAEILMPLLSFMLQDDEPERRIRAVERLASMKRTPEEAEKAEILLQERLKVEDDSEVKEKILASLSFLGLSEYAAEEELLEAA